MIAFIFILMKIPKDLQESIGCQLIRTNGVNTKIIVDRLSSRIGDAGYNPLNTKDGLAQLSQHDVQVVVICHSQDHISFFCLCLSQDKKFIGVTINFEPTEPHIQQIESLVATVYHYNAVPI